MCAFARVSVRVCVHVSVRVCMRVRVFVSMCVPVAGHALWVSLHVRMRAREHRLCACVHLSVNVVDKHVRVRVP